jgi:single-strand DNA-binding protein
VIAQYLKKGRPILIEGRLKLDQWEDKNTHQKQSKLKIVVESFQFLDSGRGDGSGGGHPDGPRVRPATAATAPTTGAAVPAETDAPGGEEDDVPF